MVIWRITLFLFDGEKFVNNVIWHIATGLFLSALICILMIVMVHTEGRRKDFSWKEAAPDYLKDLGLGFLCWIIPAAISLCVFIASGQVTIALQSEPATLIAPFLTLLIAVFFIEALPEELVRGYPYLRLEISFSAWTALLTQTVTVLFTLFAFLIGSLTSTEQWLFIPGFEFFNGIFSDVKQKYLVSHGLTPGNDDHYQTDQPLAATD